MKTDRNVHLSCALHPSLSDPLSIYAPPISFLHSPPFICCHSALMPRLRWQNKSEGFWKYTHVFLICLSAEGRWRFGKLANMQSEWEFSGNAACGVCPVATDSFWANPGKRGWAPWLLHQIRAQVLSCVQTLAFILPLDASLNQNWDKLLRNDSN